MKKALLIGIIIVLAGANVLFAFLSFSHGPKGAQETSDNGQSKIDQALVALEEEKVYVQTQAARLGINYFSRCSQASDTDISFFMFDRVSQLANKFGAKLISFVPTESELDGGYKTITFAGEANATFQELVRFFRELEYEERLVISGLKIGTPEAVDKEHRVEFELSCYEIDDSLFNNLDESLSTLEQQDSQDCAASVVARDPFVNSLQSQKTVVAYNPATAELIDLSQDLKLAGIVRSPEPTAIIEHKVVKKGDWINGKEVVAIEEDRVILIQDDQRYVIKLKGIGESTIRR